METLDRIEAETAELLALRARIDGRLTELVEEAAANQAAYLDGARTMGEWVARRFDMDRRAADRFVRTSAAMSDDVRGLLTSGKISLDRAHAYSEAELRGFDPADLDGLEIAGVWQLVRRRRPVAPVDRYLAIQPSLDEGHYRIHGRLDPAQGAIVTTALDTEMDRLTEGVPADERVSTRELRADALASICEGGERRAIVSVHRGDHAPEIDGLVASVGEAEHAECVGAVEEVVGAASGPAVRTVAPKQRRRILHRDQHRCSIEGCTSRNRLEVHHIRPRSLGGGNEDSNLVTVCWFHHHVAIHRRGMVLDRGSPPGRRHLAWPPD